MKCISGVCKYHHAFPVAEVIEKTSVTNAEITQQKT